MIAHVDETHMVEDVSCPSDGFCAATDDSGDVITSNDPSGGVGAWTITRVAPAAAAGGSYASVLCLSTHWCVVGQDAPGGADQVTQLITSTSPTAGTAGWAVRNVAAAVGGLEVSCPSETLCVGGDDSGDIVTSTDPLGGAASWTASNVDSEALMTGVSCPNTHLCVVVDGSGEVLTSTNPTGGASVWRIDNSVSGHSMSGLSCPSAELCVAVGSGGIVLGP